MVFTDCIKSKLRGIEENYFKWLDEKPYIKKSRAATKRSRKYYRGFQLNTLTVYEGECVHINIGFDVMDKYEKHDVARVLECYDDDDGEEDSKGLITVQWFVPIDEIRTIHFNKALKNAGKLYPPFNNDIELLKDSWYVQSSVDVETVTSLCYVEEVLPETRPDSVQRPKNAIGRMYVCRFSYIKKDPWVEPLSEDSLYKKCNSKSGGKKFASGSSHSKENSGRKPLGQLQVETLKSTALSSDKKKLEQKLPQTERTRRVKRKLLDWDENENRICKKSKILDSKLSPFSMSLANSSKPTPVQCTWSPKQEKYFSSLNVEVKSPQYKSNDTELKTIETIKEIGKFRGLKSLEISDLLSDADSEKRKVKPPKRYEKTKVNTPKRAPKQKHKLTPKVRKAVIKSEESEEIIEGDSDSLSDSEIFTCKQLTVEKVKRERNTSDSDAIRSTQSAKAKARNTRVKQDVMEENSSDSSDFEHLSNRTTKSDAAKELTVSAKRTPKPTEKLKNSFLKITSSECRLESPKSQNRKQKKFQGTPTSEVKRLSSKKTKGTKRKSKTDTPVIKKHSETPRKHRLQTPSKTPVVSESPSSSFQTEFEEARSRLHVSAVPSFLPCREEEFQEIFTFVEGKLIDSTGGCMYVSGVPGTGKTATVREVVRLLRETEKEGALPPFEFLEINAMKLTKPQQLWVQIWEGLTQQKATANLACSLFIKYLSSSLPKRRSILLLLDELDLLWTRKQDVMYNLFDLSARINSRLIVVTIANTMDLLERMMISRVSSRLSLTRMTFQPYTFKQLQEIIASRLKDVKVFDPDAIQLVARKVAAVSGDARRALDICRRATELVERNDLSLGNSPSPLKSPSYKKPTVGMRHVSQAINEMFSLPKITAIRQCSQMDKYLLQAVLSEFMRTGIEEATLVRVMEQFKSICRMEGLTPPSSSDTLKLVNGLSSQRIIFTEHSRLDLTLRIRLNISTDDVSYALSL